MIKLIAKKKLGFRNTETNEIIVAQPFAYTTMPDWIKNDPMYNWAINDGSLEIADDSTAKLGKKK